MLLRLLLLHDYCYDAEEEQKHLSMPECDKTCFFRWNFSVTPFPSTKVETSAIA